MMHLQQAFSLLKLGFALYAVRGIVWVLTLVFAVYAGWSDLRTRRIPNWLTVPGFFAGLALNSILDGWHGARISLEGAGLALGILLPLVLMRGFGAGDLKLMGAVGALIGLQPMLLVLLVSLLISGIIAVIQVLWTGRVKRTTRNMWVLVKGLMRFGLRPNPEISLDNPTLLKLPFGSAVAVATVLIFAMNQWATAHGF